MTTLSVVEFKILREVRKASRRLQFLKRKGALVCKIVYFSKVNGSLIKPQKFMEHIYLN